MEQKAVKLVEEYRLKETVYVVKSGDNLTKIASENNKTWQEIAKYNNLKNPNLIYSGEKIKLLT
uniref:LysM peptidoglycan-binding domain-containing protein n=1 Tax=Clostridium neonatale TaxID=137838 RepID=UPI002936DC90|nr:LysM domain-containing protein [Clostridium neonatale]